MSISKKLVFNRSDLTQYQGLVNINTLLSALELLTVLLALTKSGRSSLYFYIVTFVSRDGFDGKNTFIVLRSP